MPPETMVCLVVTQATPPASCTDWLGPVVDVVVGPLVDDPDDGGVVPGAASEVVVVEATLAVWLLGVASPVAFAALLGVALRMALMSERLEILDVSGFDFPVPTRTPAVTSAAITSKAMGNRRGFALKISFSID